MKQGGHSKRRSQMVQYALLRMTRAYVRHSSCYRFTPPRSNRSVSRLNHVTVKDSVKLLETRLCYIENPRRIQTRKAFPPLSVSGLTRKMDKVSDRERGRRKSAISC